MQDIPKQPPGPRVDAFNLHKSVGLTILALMVLRLLWRWRHPAPALPPMPAWQARLAHANHWVLYVALFVEPLAGYLGFGVQRLSGQVLRHDAAGVGAEGRRRSRI